MGPRSKDNETYDEFDCHKTVGNKSVSSHNPLQLTDGKPIPLLQHLDDERVVEKQLNFTVQFKTINHQDDIHE